jgi:hypothetical protein
LIRLALATIERAALPKDSEKKLIRMIPENRYTA